MYSKRKVNIPWENIQLISCILTKTCKYPDREQHLDSKKVHENQKHGRQYEYLITDAGVVFCTLDLVLGVERDRVPEETWPVTARVGPGEGGRFSQKDSINKNR